MKGVLSRLQSIRELKKKQAWMELVAAEEKTRQHQAHLEALQAEVTAGRAAEDEEQAAWAAHRQSWCLQMEMRRRAAERSLAEQSQIEETHREQLNSARQEARIVELVLERIEDEEAAERRRQEHRDNDEIGAMSWWRKCG